MLQFVLRRIVGAVLSLWVVLTMTFFGIHLLPGDPAEAALAQSTAPQEVLERRREALGLNRPLIVQYVDYILSFVQGRLGISWATGEPVDVMIAHQLAPTISLASISLVIGAAVGGILGYLAAVPAIDFLRYVSRMMTGLTLGMPVMFSGTLLVWLFAIKLDWLPATGQSGPFAWVLPSVVVALSISGSIARVFDASLRSILQQPYILSAQAKGLSRGGAICRHALPVSIPPVLNIIAGQFGFLLGGTVVAESLFARSGLGRLMVSAVLNQDVPVVQGLTILSCTIYILFNTIVDILHGILDPRIRSIE